MPTGSWGCIQAASQRHAFVRVAWLRHTSFLHDTRYIGICLFGILVASESWRVDDLRNGPLCIARHTSRIYIGTHLQELWRNQVEVQCDADIDALSGVNATLECSQQQILILQFSICRIVFSLFFIMNLVLWHEGSSGAVPFSTLVALLALWFGVSVPLTFVGAYFGFRKRVSGTRNQFIPSSWITMIFFSISLTGIGASSSYQPNSTPNSRSISVHTTHTRHHNGRRTAVRLHFYSIVLHFEFDLVQPNVLHVRIPVFSVLDIGHHVLGDNSAVVLFPFMCRRLPLVVAIIPHVRLHSCLFVRLLLSLLCNEIDHRRCRIDIFVLRIHAHHGVPIFPIDRHDWLHGVLLVHPEDLQCRQSRLRRKPNLGDRDATTTFIYYTHTAYSIHITITHNKNKT